MDHKKAVDQKEWNLIELESILLDCSGAIIHFAPAFGLRRSYLLHFPTQHKVTSVTWQKQHVNLGCFLLIPERQTNTCVLRFFDEIVVTALPKPIQLLLSTLAHSDSSRTAGVTRITKAQLEQGSWPDSHATDLRIALQD